MFVRGKAVDMWYVLEAPRGMELASGPCATARAGIETPCRVGLLISYLFCILRHFITGVVFVLFAYIARRTAVCCGVDG